MGDYPERAVHYTPQGLQAFLTKRYGDLATINAAWGSGFATLTGINLVSAREVDKALPYAVGRASVDVADYQADALRRLLAAWAQEVRNLDPRPLFTGRLALYRSLVSVPAEYAYVTPEAPVDVLENDLLSQNVQAVDIARQGGAVEVIPSLRLPVPPEPHYGAGLTIGRWLREAALHGARGVALDGAQRIKECPSPEDVINKLTDQLKTLAGHFDARPQASLAILYEPYAEGEQSAQVPMYGYLAGLAPGEPSLLVHALRLGTNYGLVDYLSLERLVQSDLDHYSAILAPCALRMPVEAQGKLRAYVERGGRLVCDLGAGVYETGSWQSLPEDLARLCGITGFGALQSKSADLSLSPPTPLLPSLAPPLRSRGIPREKPAPAPGAIERSTFTGTPQETKGTTIQSLSGYVTLTPEALPIALVDAQVPKLKLPPGRVNPGVAAEMRRQLRVTTKFAGIVAQPVGLGWAVYCTATLWSRWDPGDPFFQGFHADLWTPRARYVLRQPGPRVTVELSGEPEALHLNNLSEKAAMVEVLALTDTNRLYLGTFCQVPLPAPRPADPVTMVVTSELAGASLRTLRRTPVAVLPVATGALTYLRRYGPEGVALEVAGPGATLTRNLAKERTFTQGASLTARVVIDNGDYPIAPGSKHQVKLDPGFGRETTSTLQADAQGRLVVEITGGRMLIDVVPALAA